MTGLEPVASAWKAEELPLYDIRMLIFFEKNDRRASPRRCYTTKCTENLTRPIGIEPMTSGFGNLRSTN